MNSYREKKERERLLFSSLVVFGSIIVLFLLFFLIDFLKFEDFNEYTGPVKITFGSPDATLESLPVKQPEIEDVPEESIPEEEVAPVVEPIVENEVVNSKSDIIKNDIPKIEETKVVEAVKKVVKKPVVEPTPIVQKGRESGNSHETSFESTSSKVGRSGYFPISQFMPLPKEITIDIFSLITGDVTGFDDPDYNRTFFKRYYIESGNLYSLNSSVPLQNRPDLWAILDEAGYNVNNAEYKTEYNLKTVIISFEINNTSNGVTNIKSAKIESSSGNTAVDEAVLYGFKQSTYSNSTDSSVKGRFKYSFK